MRLGAGVDDCSGRSPQAGRLRGLQERECPELDGKGENDRSLTEVEERDGEVSLATGERWEKEVVVALLSLVFGKLCGVCGMDWRECVSEVTVCARSVTVSCNVDRLTLEVPIDDA